MAHTKNQFNEKALLSIADFCTYIGIGKTKAHEILRASDCSFAFRVGNRLYANKKKLDQWLLYHDKI